MGYNKTDTTGTVCRFTSHWNLKVALSRTLERELALRACRK